MFLEPLVKRYCCMDILAFPCDTKTPEKVQKEIESVILAVLLKLIVLQLPLVANQI